MKRTWLGLWLLTAAHCAQASNLPVPDAASSQGTGGSSEAGQPASGRAANGGDGGAATGGAAGVRAGAPALPALDAEALLSSSCRTLATPAELLPANILFVIDRSRSMICNPPPITDSASCENDSKRATQDPTKWDITRKALVESLKIAPEASRVGVSYFSNDEACGVQANPNVPLRRNTASQKDLIDVSLTAVKPSGATPLVGATILAYQYLHDLASDGLISGNTFVVLLTDGKQSDSCGDPARCTSADECTKLLVETEVPKAAGPGVSIRTFVIGVPGSEADQRTLSRIAVAGGTRRSPNCDQDRDCHFDVGSGGDFSGALHLALQNVLGQTRSCDLPAPRPEGGALDLVNVLYKAQNHARVVIPQDVKHECDSGANGWRYAENNTRIRLCGDFCKQVSADPAGELTVVLGCPVQGPI
ncbi:MAG TPA: VWA domain-containing protein [Polyangiales bacterium]|nr:VWA domain-containing protein [Polyangiales bacterium]